MKTGQPRLSEVAKHLVIPEGITSTGWPAVRDKCSQLGIEFDRWQDGVGRLMLAKRDDGIYACAIGGVTLSIPRQVGKTFLMGAISFALCMLTPGLTVLWTAHRTYTAKETFDSMRGMANMARILPSIETIRASHGEEAIHFKNDSRILFGAREQGFGRGFTDVGLIIFDEAQILTDRAVDDMIPAANKVENALVVMVGTPPKPVDPSEVFEDARAKALAGRSEDALYVEFGADEDASPDDWDQLAKANPSYPHRTSRTAILRMKAKMTDESYRREGMGVWDEQSAGSHAIDARKWPSLAVSADAAPTVGRVAYGVRFSVDGLRVGLAAARRPDDSSVVHVEAIREELMSEGMQWLIDWLSERMDTAAQVVIDGKAGSAALVTELRRAGARGRRSIILPTLDQVIAAHTMFDEAVKTSTISHAAQPALDDQIHAATRRKIGSHGGFGWQAPDGGSVALFEAATLAHWGAVTTKRSPGAKSAGTGRTNGGRTNGGRTNSGRAAIG